MHILALNFGDVEIRRCPYIGTTELKDPASGKTAEISSWHKPNEQELIYAGTKLLREAQRDAEERQRRQYFWLGAEAGNGW